MTNTANGEKGEPMELLLIAITCWLLLQLAFTIWNLSQMPRLGEPVQRQSWEQRYDEFPASVVSRAHGGKPLLSVLIPARDEERNIRACLESISACRADTIELEILVMNDHSEDDTEAEIYKAMAHDDRIQLFHGGKLPEGWLGKSYACHQLSLHACGEWWLFVDADVRLQPEALEAAMMTARAQRTGLISGFPRMDTGTWLEHIVVPMMAFIIGYHLPIMMIRRSPRPVFLAVTGAWLMVHRHSYTRSGGHAHIYNHIVEDMELARAVKQAGDPVTLADVHRHTSARMYRNAAEVWEGYKKNIFAGTGRSPLLVLGITLFYGLLFVFPLVVLIWSVCTAQFALAGWAGAAVLIGMITKGIIDRFSGKSCWLGLLMPVSALCLILILIDSWIASLNGKGYRWKGRTYG
ncbi:glycosyltransferase [Paenibacillus sp. SGZ-1009]|uniref:glycosyltransferase n=1 Tax=Paenibacillus campi TaxID=3106031 RepID=UPI002AFF3112|nr:glycosyltransferase [Paenibacillus sp. SGZ-1009]